MQSPHILTRGVLVLYLDTEDVGRRGRFCCCSVLRHFFLVYWRSNYDRSLVVGYVSDAMDRRCTLGLGAVDWVDTPTVRDS